MLTKIVCTGFLAINLCVASLSFANEYELAMISTGDQATCLLKDHKLKCWGYNQAGINPSVLDTPPNINSISYITSNNFNCAISDGKPVCWGFDPRYGDFTAPPDLSQVSSIAIGNSRVCAISNSKVECWGRGSSRLPKDLGNVSAIDTRGDYICALTTAGTVRCWGYGADEVNQPSNLDSVTAISVGSNSACAITDSGVRCWGYILSKDYQRSELSSPELNSRAIAIDHGLEHACAVTENHKLTCWGDNSYGQLETPENIGKIFSLSLGDFNTCVLSESGPHCWGHNDLSQSTTQNDLVDFLFQSADCIWTKKGVTKCKGAYPPKDLGKVISVESGLKHACALNVAKKVRCWNKHDGIFLDC